MKDYDAAIKEFCIDNPGKTIYLAGEISNPGISDLDFLIVDHPPVVNDNVKTFLMGGNVIIMPEFLMNYVNNFENFKLRHLQGKKYILQKPEEYFEIIEILEWLPERILKSESIDDKYEYMLFHKSLNRSVKKVENMLSLSFEKIEDEELRRSNFKINKVKEKTLKYALSAWKNFDSYVLDKKILYGDASGSINISNYYSFECKFNSLMLYFKMLSSSGELKLTKELRKKINITGKVIASENFKNYSLDRWRKLDKIYRWFIAKNIKKGMIKYGWFL